MQSENKMFDDFVKMVNGFAGTMAGMGREAESSAREKFREWVGGQDFVGRDEFEAVKAMAAAARDENEILKARIAALEAKTAGPTAGSTVIDLNLPSRQAVDESHARLCAAGYANSVEPWDTFFGARYAIICDQDGHRVGLKSPQDPSRSYPLQ